METAAEVEVGAETEAVVGSGVGAGTVVEVDATGVEERAVEGDVGGAGRGKV